MLSCRGLSPLVVTFLTVTPVSLARTGSEPSRSSDEQLFPLPPLVRKQVRFWEKIFFTYPSTTVIVHESTNPDRIIDVIDYKVTAFAHRLPVPRRGREAITTRYLRRYEKAVGRFGKEGHQAIRYGAIEQRLYDIYRDDAAGLRQLYSGSLRLRAQAGLADDFLQAAAAAQAHLPYMEQIFAQYGVPRRLTRLPFVESMFNSRALSKVGASGIWQFMPATARSYLLVNDLVDERNAPAKATKAAAQFLANNYRILASWPLAITAYNHGVDGMSRAVRQLGTRDIGTVVAAYASPSFGFASRNFYAEVLAAGNVYQRLVQKHVMPDPPAEPAVASVQLHGPMSLQQLVAHSGLSRQELEALNPCLLKTTLAVNAHRPLPVGYQVMVPKDREAAIKRLLSRNSQRRYAKNDEPSKGRL